MRRKIKINPLQLEKKSRSGLEDKARLILHKHKIQHEYEPKDKKLEWVEPVKYHKYLPDIQIGNIIYETKGRFTLQDRTKMLLLKQQHPNIRFIMVFQKNQPIRKGSKTLYSDWCNKNGIEWIEFKDFEKHIKTLHGK